MISAQYGTEFTGEEYGKIKKVYSIWICTDPPKRLNNTIFRYSMKQEVVAGAADFAYKESDFDLISVIFFCLGKSDAKNKVLGLLNLLLIEDVSAIKKCRRLEADFGIAMTNDFSKEVDYMCNLSSGVLQRGYEKGMAQGKAQGIAQGKAQGITEGFSQGITISLKNLMKNKNFTLDDSMSALGIPPSEKEKYAALLNIT